MGRGRDSGETSSGRWLPRLVPVLGIAATGVRGNLDLMTSGRVWVDISILGTCLADARRDPGEAEGCLLSPGSFQGFPGLDVLAIICGGKEGHPLQNLEDTGLDVLYAGIIIVWESYNFGSQY